MARRRLKEMPELQLIQLKDGEVAVALVLYREDGKLVVSVDDYLLEYSSNKEGILSQIDKLRETISRQEPLLPKEYRLRYRVRHPVF